MMHSHTALTIAEGRIGTASATAKLDADVLLRFATSRRPIARCDPQSILSPAELDRFQRLVDRRRHGEPVAYLIGEREFWSLSLRVSPATLIPRPDTERLVEQALTRVPANACYTIADLGTGCGAIALAIAHERPSCRVFATERSVAALEIARANAQRLAISNVTLRAGNWYAPLHSERFELIVANPPYVASDDPHLAHSDVRHEPRLALDGGADGLVALRIVVANAWQHLLTNGWLMVEHGYDQGAAVRHMFNAHDYAHVQTYQDLAGIDRVTEGCRGVGHRSR